MGKKLIQTKAGKSKYIYNFEELEILCEVLQSAKNKKTLKDLIIDLFTAKQIAEITRRVLIGYAITRGFTFQNLAQNCGVSPNTTSVLRRKIYFGNNELKKALENINISKIETELQKGKCQTIGHGDGKYIPNKYTVIYGHKTPTPKD